jgi:hypothetical protein
MTLCLVFQSSIKHRLMNKTIYRLHYAFLILGNKDKTWNEKKLLTNKIVWIQRKKPFIRTFQAYKSAFRAWLLIKFYLPCSWTCYHWMCWLLQRLALWYHHTNPDDLEESLPGAPTDFRRDYYIYYDTIGGLHCAPKSYLNNNYVCE